MCTLVIKAGHHHTEQNELTAASLVQAWLCSAACACQAPFVALVASLEQHWHTAMATCVSAFQLMRDHLDDLARHGGDHCACHLGSSSQA